MVYDRPRGLKIKKTHNERLERKKRTKNEICVVSNNKFQTYD